ncbi:Hypothetical predicted protein [Octopus vulgaris]|uniref:Uncharacterized protein n=1 Tax=Octopus vulgaris TaxID=6645 RepID=A0AA36BWY7_OCTVU|nr:Hypothetical predicted protein [Octopus vulgaris]
MVHKDLWREHEDGSYAVLEYEFMETLARRNLEILLKLSLSTLTPVLTSSSFTLSLHIYYYKNHMKLAKRYFLLLKNHQYVSCLKGSAKIFYKRIILLL